MQSVVVQWTVGLRREQKIAIGKELLDFQGTKKAGACFILDQSDKVYLKEWQMALDH